jgi:hypothetical protein
MLISYRKIVVGKLCLHSKNVNINIFPTLVTVADMNTSYVPHINLGVSP